MLEEAAGILWCDAGARLGDRVVELGLDPRGDLAEIGLDLREGGSMGAKSGEELVLPVALQTGWASLQGREAARCRLAHNLVLKQPL